MVNLLLVGSGGFIGAALRFLISKFFSHLVFFNVPFAIIIVNLLGSFLMGLVSAKEVNFYGENLFFFLTAGVLGGFTTFSAFSAESILLLKSNHYASFFIYQIISVVGSLTLYILGNSLVSK